jgi:peroxiredoxin
MTTISAAEYLQMKSPKKSKYGNQKTVVDGITFDSKAEANFYKALKIRADAGEIHAVEMQKRYELTVNGALITTYRADFAFQDDALKRYRVVDVKGVETPAFKLKRKLMRACHGIEVECVKP